MKKLTTMLLLTLIVSGVSAQKADKKVRKAVNAFVTSADVQDADALEKVLHPEFRVVLNRQMGSTETSILDRAGYVGLVRDKKIGGDKRTVNFLHVNTHGNNATVIAEFKGQKAVFHSTLLLVKGTDDNWQIVQDFPDISTPEGK